MAERTKRILIIDDDKDIRALLRVYIEKRGYETEEAESGNEAIAIFKEKGVEHGFDLVITDQVMPGIDGLTTFQEIQKVDGRLAAIMLTGFPTINLTIRFIQQGGINFLTKPFDTRSEVLAVIIKEAINYKRIKRAQTETVREVSSEPLVFVDDDEKTKAPPISYNASPWKVLIADDDEAAIDRPDWCWRSLFSIAGPWISTPYIRAEKPRHGLTKIPTWLWSWSMPSWRRSLPDFKSSSISVR
ncbi:MAG: response regulator [Nitrospinota bacterium]